MADELSDHVVMVEQLMKLFDEAAVAKLEFEGFGFSLRIKRGVSSESSPQIAPPRAAFIEEKATGTGTSTDAPGRKRHIVDAGITGTFFRSSSPDKAAFVSVGDSVEVGQTVCLIEAMKMMNEVDAGVAGTVLEILVEDGMSVTAGTPLFIIEVGDVR